MNTTSLLGALSLLVGAMATAQETQVTTSRYRYDASGNLTEHADPLGRVSTFAFDSLDRRTRDQQPLLANGIRPAISVTFDGRDNITGVTDPRKLSTRYTVDGFGQQTGLRSPDTGSTTLAYDLAGNVRRTTDARGKTTTLTYDALNRVTRIAFATGDASNFEYDGGLQGASNAIGRLTKMTDESGETAYAYDAMGRLSSTLQTIKSAAGSVSLSLAYGYGTTGSAIGKRTSVTYPSGNRVDYTFDSAGRINSIRLTLPAAATGTSTVLLKDIDYSPFGPALAWNWGNHSDLAPNRYVRTFDLDGRVATYPLGNSARGGLVRRVSYDAASHVTAFSHSGANGAAFDRTFDYDELGRLTRSASAGTSQVFSYDASGNRTQVQFGVASYVNRISATSNRLTSTSGPAPAKTNTYDAAGNLTSDGTIRYTYSDRGRLSRAVNAGVTINYKYNGLGQRVAKVGTTAGSVSFYVYDAQGRLLGEYGAAGRAAQETVYLDDMPVVVLTTTPGTVTGTTASTVTAVSFVYADHINTPRVLTRASDNAIVWRWDTSDPFGLQQPNENPSGLGPLTYSSRFPGQYYDRETNLYHNGFRDYDPQTGRYLQSDPIGLAGGINTYTYVGGNPVSHVDPTGLACPPQLKEIGACIDSSNYDPNLDCKGNVAGDAGSDNAARANAYRLDRSDNDENYAMVTKDNLYKPANGTGAETDIGYRGVMEIDPATTKAIIHSHPRSDSYSAAPGYGDAGALNSSFPNYVTRRGTTNVLERVDGQYQFRRINGRLTQAERRATQDQLDEFQKNSRTDKCGCKK